MHCSPLVPFGHEITGIDLALIDDRDLREARRHLTSTGVVVFRQQALSDDAFVRFLERFAPLTFTQGERPVDGQPKLNAVSNVGRETPPRSVFHSDTSYVQRPPSFTALRAITVPSTGGETLFSNQYLAYDALEEKLRRALERARVHHRVSGLRCDQIDETSNWHPLFRRHPESRRIALYLSTPERCVALADTALSDSDGLIAELYRRSTEPARLYVHQWQAGDVLMWDNRCTMHRADHSQVVGDRVMHRGMCAGERPLAAHGDAAGVR